MTTTKTITKVIIYYADGTFEEVKAGADNAQNKQNTPYVNPSPVAPRPDFRPDLTQMRDWNEYPPMKVTCATGNVPLIYSARSDNSMMTYSFTSTGNADNLNKYSITSTGNGNVDLSK